jgi:hypothetical protein
MTHLGLLDLLLNKFPAALPLFITGYFSVFDLLFYLEGVILIILNNHICVTLGEAPNTGNITWVQGWTERAHFPIRSPDRSTINER